MNTAAFAVRPTVSRAQAFSTSTPAGGWQAERGNIKTIADTSLLTADLLLARNRLGPVCMSEVQGNSISAGAGELVAALAEW